MSGRSSSCLLCPSLIYLPVRTPLLHFRHLRVEGVGQQKSYSPTRRIKPLLETLNFSLRLRFRQQRIPFHHARRGTSLLPDRLRTSAWDPSGSSLQPPMLCQRELRSLDSCETA